jgi:hypothetical protein
MSAVAAPTPSSETSTAHWRTDLPHVRKALTFVRRTLGAGGHVTTDELVEWDRTHGRRLFNWNDSDAAEEWRRTQARLFLNRFRARFEGMRVRAFIHVREDLDQGIEQGAYYAVETIAQHPGMREQVINDITKRMTSLGTELQMWRLSDTEREVIFEKLRAAMNGAT